MLAEQVRAGLAAATGPVEATLAAAREERSGAEQRLAQTATRIEESERLAGEARAPVEDALAKGVPPGRGQADLGLEVYFVDDRRARGQMERNHLRQKRDCRQGSSATAPTMPTSTS